jgi:hypothetical protein
VNRRAMAVGGTVLRACGEFADLDDVELGARFLADQQVHAGRSPDQLRDWAEIALEAGRAAARRTSGSTAPEVLAQEQGLAIVAGEGGLRPGWVVVAEYAERRSEIRVHDDVIELADQLVDQLGWRDWYPPGVLRQAAIAHELGHRALHGRAARALRAQLGLVTLRCGRFRMYGHVTGAPELFAHGFAEQFCGLGRSPLLLTTALARAAGALTGKEGA